MPLELILCACAARSITCSEDKQENKSSLQSAPTMGQFPVLWREEKISCSEENAREIYYLRCSPRCQDASYFPESTLTAVDSFTSSI